MTCAHCGAEILKTGKWVWDTTYLHRATKMYYCSSYSYNIATPKEES